MYERAARAVIPPRFREALEQYEPGTRDLTATWGEFILTDGTPFGALQLALPAGVKADELTLFGILGDSTFFEPLPVQHSQDDAFVERSMLIPPQAPAGTFGLARRNEILGMARVTVEPPTEVSRLILAGDVHLLPAKQDPLDPFAFGGTKVVPKPGATFRRTDDVWVFLEMRSAALPQISTKVDIEGEGIKRSGLPGAAEATALK